MKVVESVGTSAAVVAVAVAAARPQSSVLKVQRPRTGGGQRVWDSKAAPYWLLLTIDVEDMLAAVAEPAVVKFALVAPLVSLLLSLL